CPRHATPRRSSTRSARASSSVSPRTYIGRVSLRLVTGPANAGKAGEIMRAYRARLSEEPLLVVPALRDVDHMLRELAATGAVLERAMVEPDVLDAALDRAGRARGRPAEAAAIYRRYRERLDAAGLVDAELFAWRALDALRERPLDFGRTPLFVYGFDDFTPIE